MYKILCVVNKTTDAMAYYRSALPLIRMSQECTNISVDFISPSVIPKWDLLSQYNILLSQRPDTDKHVDFISKCKVHKLKIWVDFDDAFWHVTMDSPAFSYYNSKDADSAVRSCIELADVISVSTLELSKSLKEKFNKDSFVVENAVDIYGMQHLSSLKGKSNSIVWRGSHTHQADLLDVQDDIVSIDKSGDYKWMFMGYNPWMIAQKLRASTHVDYLDEPTMFFETLRRVDGNMMIVPLNDNPFNRCKSNIAGMEAILCGLLPVVPLWWDDLNFLGEGTFKERTQELLGMDESRKQSHHKDLLCVLRDNYNLVDVNKFRYDIIKNL